MKIEDRIEAILRYTGLNKAQFAKAIGVNTAQAVYDLAAGRTKTISPTIENKILSYCPKISRSWLLTGEGEMLTSPTTQINQNGNGVAVGINNGTTTIPQASPPNSQELYRLLLEMAKEVKETNERCQKLTEDAKETHQLAVDILRTASDMMTNAYKVSDAIKVGRENVQSLFRDLREAREKNVADNTRFLEEQKVAFAIWVEEQKKQADALIAEFTDKLHQQTRETQRNVNESTRKIVHASTERIVDKCKSVDLSELNKGMNSLLLYYNLSRGAEKTNGQTLN